MANRKVKTGSTKPATAKTAAPKRQKPVASAAPVLPVAAAKAKAKADKPKSAPAKAAPAVVEAAVAPVKAAAAAPVEAVAVALESAPAAVAAVPAEAVPAAVEKSGEAAAEAIIQTAETIEYTSNKGTEIMTKETNRAGQAATDRFQAAFAEVNERTKVAVEKSSRIVEELTDLTKGNVEAFVASSKVAARGVEELSREAAEYGRRSFEDASAALKSFADIKSPTDFFKLQGDFARSAFDSIVAESSKVSETVIKLAGEVAQPLTSRYAVAAERVKTIAS